MAFRKKNLLDRTSTRTNIFKYLTMFFLGASCVILATQAFNINSSLTNAVQFIRQIVLTNDGSNLSTTGIILDGTIGGGITITNLPNEIVLGTNPNGEIIGSSASSIASYLSSYIGASAGRWTGNGI